MSVRAKFSCSFVDQKQKTVYMAPVYSGSEENKEFFSSTPGGQIILNILNGAALAKFQQGTEYYIDFTPTTPIRLPGDAPDQPAVENPI